MSICSLCNVIAAPMTEPCPQCGEIRVYTGDIVGVTADQYKVQPMPPPHADLLARLTARVVEYQAALLGNKVQWPVDDVASLFREAIAAITELQREREERLYWAKATAIVSDTLAQCSVEKFEEKRDKLVAILRNAAYRVGGDDALIDALPSLPKGPMTPPLSDPRGA